MGDIQTQFGLEHSDIKAIVDILKRNKKVEKIIFFGSRAKNSYSNGSDIDIALTGKSLHTNDILNLSVDLDELDLPYKIDLVIYERIEEKSLKEHIDRVGVVLFERE
ncbi:MAG: nucleotidyltransferase domain-containing protein [Bacteroidales bacterium]|nr:nucleotidyltransferase domain-containing protein [Bacteroidales bacterium]MCF8338427.1 nucleotidyltransferase domain-containing protein [Bacteroidales bacterium]